MALIAYAATAAILLWLAHRFVRPLSRWAAIVLLLLPLTLTGFALFTSRVYAPVDLPWEWVPLNWMKGDYGVQPAHTNIHSDVYTLFIPWRKAVQMSLSRGEWGLWNPSMFNGDILLATEEPAVSSPLTWIAVLMPVALSFTFTAAITLFIAAAGAFFLARELECREGTALVAAIGWSLANSVVMFLLVSMGATWAWAPLVFLGVRRVARDRDLRAAGLLTFALTALVVSAHPESLLFVVILGALYGLFELWSGGLSAHRRAKSSPLHAIALAIGAGVIALALNAIHLLPFAEAMPHTMEYQHRQTIFQYAPRGVPPEHALGRMATTFFPYLHSRPWNFARAAPQSHTTGAVGSIILGLALYGLWRRRSAERAFFGALALFCVVTGAEWRPVAKALSRIPLVDIALFDRMSIGAALALAVLAALGAEELCRRERDRGAVVTMIAVLLVVAAGNALFLRSAVVSHQPMRFGDYVIVAEIALLAVACFLARRRALPLLLGALLVQRVVSIGDVYKPLPQRVAYPPIPILEPLKHVKEPFRIVGHSNTFPIAMATMYELEDARGFSGMTLLRYRETVDLWSREQPVFYNRVDDLTRPFLSFLNVRYAILWYRDAVPDGWRVVARQPGSSLIENTRAIERAFVPRSVRVGYAPNINLLQMALESDFRARAWIEAPGPAYERGNGPGRVSSITRRRLGYDLTADMQGDGWIATSILAWPGWRAYVDGKRIETQIVNHAFVAVHVPQGRHQVRLTYWPRSFVIGRAISAATLLLLVIFAVVRR